MSIDSDEVVALRARIAELEREVRVQQQRSERHETALRGFAAVIAHAPVAVLVLDADGVVVDLNSEAELLCGQRRDAMLGHPLAEFVPDERQARLRTALRRCATGDVVKKAEVLLWGQAAKRVAHSSILFPMRAAGGRVTGMVLCEDIADLRGHGELLETVNRELLALVRADPLTGLANRRQYEQRLADEVGRLARDAQPLSLLMIDVDDFKSFNDTHGHAAGDACLIAVARAVAGVIHRTADLCARYGGEEFVVVLPNTDHDGARAVAERMRAAVLALRVEHPAARAGKYVTISAGVATAHPRPGFDGRALQEAADRALYAAKRGGRNRVGGVELKAPRERGRVPWPGAAEDGVFE
ncbi:MAG: GGDEF domain-containing protein [Planctomycetes bacterium]|nr:GGDEF domain-containing protein [Planctomycetota bacterium]